MNHISKQLPVLILIVSAFLLSGVMLRLFNDPEGPNLLIVAVFAAVIFCASLVGNYFHSGTFAIHGRTRIIIAAVVQFLTASILYFFLK